MAFNSNIYNVDWGKLTRWLVPPVLRRPKMMAALRAFTSAINDLHTRFMYYRAGALYRLGITPQVCHLERALNDRYDVVERRIYIEDGTEKLAIPLFRREESKPLKLFRKSENKPLSLYTKAETAQFTADFVIVVPVTVPFDLAEMIAFVNGYKLASKTFKVRIQ